MIPEELSKVAQEDGLPVPFSVIPFTTVRACGCPCDCQDIAQARVRFAATPEPVQAALRAAVAALYFADSSDFQTALYQVVNSIDPALAILLDKDGNPAFRVVYQEPEE